MSDPTQIERFTNQPWNYWIVVVVATLGSTIGSLIGYYIGAKGGRPVSSATVATCSSGPTRSSWPSTTFERDGAATAFFSRLIPIVRTFISFPARAHAAAGKFIAYSTAGAFIWSMALVQLGVLFGERWDQIRKALASAV